MDQIICKDCNCYFVPATGWEHKNGRHNMPNDCLKALKLHVESQNNKINELTLELKKYKQ